jgi:glutamate-1-semialdehyde 2,1-aminomutase
MGLVPPQPGFLEGLRRLTKKSGALLIFDEVITGFRVAYGGAQGLYKVTPDLTCLGKIIGGGLPVGAYGGRREIMEMLAPSGSVYQAGTLSGNPVVMRAGIETLTILSQSEIYAHLETLSSRLATGIAESSKERRISLQVSRVGSILCTFFTAEPIIDYETACRADTELYARFFHRMLSKGVYLPPSQFEACFVSAVHTLDDVEATIDAVKEALGSL